MRNRDIKEDLKGLIGIFLLYFAIYLVIYNKSTMPYILADMIVSVCFFVLLFFIGFLCEYYKKENEKVRIEIIKAGFIILLACIIKSILIHQEWIQTLFLSVPSLLGFGILYILGGDVARIKRSKQ